MELNYCFDAKNLIIRNDQRFEMEKMRLQTFYLFNSQRTKKDQVDKLEKLMPFEWDKKTFKSSNRIEAPTEDQWAEMDKRVKNMKKS